MEQSNLENVKNRAEYTLNTVNSWINNIDAKASYALSFVGVLIGFVLIHGSPQIFSVYIETEKCNILILFGLIAIILLYLFSFITICFFVCTIMARTTPNTNTESYIFYGKIALCQLTQYNQKFKSMSEQKYVDELIDQIHVNSCICNKKISLYRKGIFSLMITISLCFICCIFHIL